MYAIRSYYDYISDSITINTKIFSKGMTDASKDRPLMNDTTASAFIVSYMQRREKARREAEYSEQIEAGNSWLKANAAKDSVVTPPSGLQYKIIRQGTGATSYNLV